MFCGLVFFNGGTLSDAKFLEEHGNRLWVFVDK